MRVGIVLFSVLSLLHTSFSLECFNCYTAYRRHYTANDTDRRLNIYDSTLDDYNNTDGVAFADPFECQSHECSEGDKRCLILRWDNWELEKKKGWEEDDKKKWVIWEYRGCYHEAMSVFDTVNTTLTTWKNLPDVWEKYENGDFRKTRANVSIYNSDRGDCDVDLCNSYPKARLTLLPKIATAAMTLLLLLGLPAMWLYDMRYGPKEDQKPTEDTAAEPAADTAEDTAADTAEDTAAEPAAEPAEDTAAEPAEDTAAEPAAEPAAELEEVEDNGAVINETPDGIELGEMQPVAPDEVSIVDVSVTNTTILDDSTYNPNDERQPLI